MRGHVPTPAAVADVMVAKLFSWHRPKPHQLVVDPGCGDGVFIDAVLRYCATRSLPPPRVLGVEEDARLAEGARGRFESQHTIRITRADFLRTPCPPADFIVGNPPYVSILGLEDAEKRDLRSTYLTARGRFDLYMLFFERSISSLRPGGRLVFITPEKFEYVDTAMPLRRMLASLRVRELIHLGEDTFPGVVSYPTITVLEKRVPRNRETTTVTLRDGIRRKVTLLADGSSWNPAIRGAAATHGDATRLESLCVRVSCGVATGSDQVFVHREVDLPESLRPFAHPTIAGRQLGLAPYTDERELRRTRDMMLVPYDGWGRLLPEDALGDLRVFLRRSDHSRLLRGRSCVARGRRVWYRFHDNVPLPDLLQPKILCKDITSAPRFWIDRSGSTIPRHSVYYIVPRPGVDLDLLLNDLNSRPRAEWLMANCQRAANGFYRLQSNVLRGLPVPRGLASSSIPHEGGAGASLTRPSRTTPYSSPS